MIKEFLALSIILLLSCTANTTPDKVANNFWNAVASKDFEKAKLFAVEETMKNASFSDDANVEIVNISDEPRIEDYQAYVDTEINVSNKGKVNSYKFETILVNKDNEWKVDFDKTTTSMIGFSMKQFEDAMKQTGKAIGEAMGEAIKEMGKAMGEAMEDMADKAKDAIENQKENP